MPENSQTAHKLIVSFIVARGRKENRLQFPGLKRPVYTTIGDNVGESLRIAGQHVDHVFATR